MQRKPFEKERERSPERKHIQMLAAAALEVMIKLEPRGNRNAAAAKIARHVNRWPGMGAQDVTAQTVIAWRNQQRSSSKSARKTFEQVVARMQSEPDPDKTVDQLLKRGPPGHWKS